MALLASLPEDTLRIPARAHTLAGFREWAHSEDFPEHERIDFLGGEVEVEMSPEDPQSHGAPRFGYAERSTVRPLVLPGRDPAFRLSEPAGLEIREIPMIRVEIDETIERPIEEVFERLVEIPRYYRRGRVRQ